MTRYIISFTLVNDNTRYQDKVYAHSVLDACLKAKAQDTRRQIYAVQDEAFLPQQQEA